MDFDKKMCPIVNVEGAFDNGKQFDIEINLPEDNRSVIYGLIKDCYDDPVKDAVVKLIEVCGNERKPVTHTFTNKDGIFVFGPLCPDKSYEVAIWANRVKHYKICSRVKHEGKCLKGEDLCCEQHDNCEFENFGCREAETCEE